MYETSLFYCVISLLTNSYYNKGSFFFFISGLPTFVLRNAAAKSKEFEATYGKCRKETNLSTQDWVDEMIVIIQRFNNAARDLRCQETVCVSSLSELQGKASELLRLY